MSLPSSAPPSERYGCPQCLSVFRAGFARCPLDGAALQGLTGDPLIGHTLAERYVIEELLGEGGMGRVYRARHNRMSRRFAVKVLFGDMAADAKARTRFSREAEAVSRLNHPNVLSVVDFGETDEGLLYLVMDFIEGRELHQLLAQEAPLSTQRVLSLLRQLSRGLAHAHERNLVHRDFKTENVVVTKSGDEELARIVDFGIAAVGEMMEPAQRLTTEGMVLGTPAYMSPEQSTGEEVDERSDLFSLGVMLYEMLCGRLPFDGTAVAIAKAHLASEVPAVAARVPGLRVDPRLEAASMRLMAKDPEERFQSARALLAHLDSAFGRADSQEGEDHDATVQMGSDARMPAAPAGPSGEQVPIEPYRYTPYEMAEMGASGPSARVRDPRWVITGGVVLVMLLVVAAFVVMRGGDDPPARASASEQASEPAASPTMSSRAAPVPPPARPDTAAKSDDAAGGSAPPSEPSEPASTAEPRPLPVEPDPAASGADAQDDEDEQDEQREEPAESKRTDRADRSPPRVREKRPRVSKRSSSARSIKSSAAEKEEPKTRPEPAVAAPAPPPSSEEPAVAPSEPAPSYSEFVALHRATGKKLSRIIAKHGEGPVAKLRLRYMELPVGDAALSASVLRDADRALRAIAARLERQFGDL